MVELQDSFVFPAPPATLWRLLEAHLDPAQITAIHPLVRSQALARREGDAVVLRRTIDARGRRLTSEWRVTAHPPDVNRWEILTSEGPYATGSWLENRYVPVPGGTRVDTRSDLRITVLPFFLPQRPVIRRVFDSLDREDTAYLARLAAVP
jgi:hypothetical protein